MRAVDRAVGRVHEFIVTTIAGTLAFGDRLNGQSFFCGLKWSPDMPDDDPDADLLVIDENGVEYVLTFDVWLNATGKTHHGEKAK